jgi:hypothetical protein
VGALSPRARRTSLEGRPLRCTGGPRGPPGSRLCCLCVLGVRVDLCFAFFAGFKRVSPGYLGDPLVPDSSPRASVVYPSGSRRCWSLLIGCSSLLVADAFPRGHISGPAGLAPEALQERECSCRGSLAKFHQRAWYLFQPASVILQSASVTRATSTSHVWCTPEVAVRRAPKPGPIRGDRGELSVLL